MFAYSAQYYHFQSYVDYKLLCVLHILPAN